MPSGIRFPVDLPHPDRAGYGDEYEEIRARFQPEVGAPRHRNRMRVAPRWFDVVWTLTDDDYAIFDHWWQETIKGGVSEFDIQLLDDYNSLTWFTVIAPLPYEAERLNPQQSWRVSWRVRALDETFGTDRPSGTDELEGLAVVGIQQASGALRVYTPFRGTTSIGLRSATTRLSLPPLRGITNVGFYILPFGRLNVLLPDTPARQWMDLDWIGEIAAQDLRTLGFENREWMEI